MNTHVKLPHFLERFLNIYSVITVAFGFITILLINLPYSKSAEVMAAQSSKKVEEITACVTITNNSDEEQTYVVEKKTHQCKEKCGQPGGGGCSVCDNANHMCQTSIEVKVEEITLEAGESQTITHKIKTPPCGSAQPDIWIQAKEAHEYTLDCSSGACKWFCNRGKAGGSRGGPQGQCLTADNINDDKKHGPYWGYIDTNRDDCEAEPPSEDADVCEYGSTQARVQQSTEHAWAQEIHIQQGESFNIGGFHNHSGQFEDATDLKLTVTGPGINFSCDTDETGCNGHRIENVEQGTYRLTVQTYNEDKTAFYPEAGCNETATVYVGTTPSDTCPYYVTRAQVQEDAYHDWAYNITIYRGDSFRIGSFHNNIDRFVEDTRLTVTDPNGNAILTCDGTLVDGDCNGRTLTASLTGIYILRVTTYNQSSGVYNERECNDTAQVEVLALPTPRERDHMVQKVVLDEAGDEYEQRTVQSGEEVTFQVTIENTGEVTIENLRYLDQYEERYLSFLSIRGRHETSTNWRDLTRDIDPLDPDANRGEFEIADLTEYLGDLETGESFILQVTFEVIGIPDQGPLSACNLVITDDGFESHKDSACIIIQPQQAPPTDR